VLDVLLFLCQSVQLAENTPWNLLLMEILFNVFRGQDPYEVAVQGPSASASSVGDGGRASPSGSGEGASPGEREKRGDSAFSQILRHERMSRAALSHTVMSRHSRFGTNLRLEGANGTTARWVLSLVWGP
jgi:hypothetical protein